ncbi:molybdopterin-containing oxidoreductase family iron-sulfur binding subunit [Gelidibacter algens]|uniref:Molybdopterin-containing oxidoreductase family iron-sulfur binding subunit n=1 Tax=Gelidibacter algens TaxID=49280 RepID=A0A1A7QQX5_9FLAO|nr:TAT-variant-translocated molybdopterin oxidoreductase [Gelidibacter algens]OBX21723.1 quinol:cytochrome C oxidoreductase [Gelidibacter algens]RAJ23046.1 molybdopterin-containing oxidoreductase family iron-sulfur binding subunit [Gelidibacter algens]
MSSNKKYWKSVEELNTDSSIVEALRQNEFVEEIPTDEFLGNKSTLGTSATTRRDFLKYVGFSTAAVSLAACEGPIIKSIPYVVQPESIIPGVANFYATTIANGYDFASILVRTREGRPINIQNNDLGQTGANARVNASVLGLYDSMRLQAPVKNGNSISWETFDAETNQKLTDLTNSGKEIVLLTQTFASPSASKLISSFKEKYGNVRHVVYDAISVSGALDAYQAKYGERALPNYDFSKAATIVSVGADFLGDWCGGGYDAGYALGRIPKNGKMSRHIQIEANMSLTGANADKRIPATPSQQRMVLAKIHGYITGQSVSADLPAHIEKEVEKVASELRTAGSNGVLVTGFNDVNAQTIVLNINAALGSKAFDTKSPITTRQGSDQAVSSLVMDMNAGKVGAIIMCGVNPLYTLPNANEFAEGLKKTELSIAFSMKADETALATQYIAATPHYLESWGDVELKKGHFALMQPTIRPLFDTRQFEEALLKWTGSDVSYHDFIKETWNNSILGGGSFNQALHDGVFSASSADTMAAIFGENMASNSTATPTETSAGTAFASTTAISGGDAARALVSAPKSDGFELTLYSKVGMGDGKQANNPWLQEFPDPISRVSWDNYLLVSKTDAAKLGIKNWHVADGGLNSSLVELTLNGVSEILPVIIQPGQAVGSIGMAFGYGRSKGLKEEMQTGKNAYKFYEDFKETQSGASIKVVAGEHEFALIQLHNTLMGRNDIIKETTLEIFNTKDKSYWNAVPMVSLNHIETPVTSPEVDLWDEFDRSMGHHFNLAIDLNACTGCGACVVACQAENNVPVVGKKEVRKSRDMYWLRIDRYYSSEETFAGDVEKKENISGLLGDNGSVGVFDEMESAAMNNPQVAFQPIMCQHCNHAPCETVCPVAATSHGRQGQNQMVYNRCVGTRYCANNCPYKVRRFNWFSYNKNDEFDYYMNDDLGRMVLNPDVTVRSRGVMEKCSFCIQKTQKTILDAKLAGREIKDVEFHTACSAACDKGAMVFGDINDKESKVAKLKEDKRMYHLLEYIGTKPNVQYHTIVRNTTEA